MELELSKEGTPGHPSAAQRDPCSLTHCRAEPELQLKQNQTSRDGGR